MIARRGLIKRTTYGLIGAGGAAAVCNPTLAKDYAQVSYTLAKKKLTELYDQYGGLFIANTWFSYLDKFIYCFI